MRNDLFTPTPDPGTTLFWENERVEIVALPLLMYAVGIYRNDELSLFLALLCWGPVFGILSLWVVWRVTDRFPSDDVWRAVATLIYGGAAWLLLFPVLAPVPKHLQMAIAFPCVFAPGVLSILAARRRGLSPLPADRRALLLSLAALICVIWVVVFCVLWWTYGRRPLAAWPFELWFTVPLAALAVFLAAKLVRSAVKGFKPGRPLTAQSLLGDDDTTAASP